MELRQLRAFVAVVRCASFSRAADELDLTQPAVTAQIQALERELGTMLLERLPRRTMPTQAGEALLTYAEALLNLEAEAGRALAELRGLQAGTLRVGASPTVGTYLLPKMLGKLKGRYPGLRLIAEIEPTHRVAQALETFALDVGLVEAPVSSESLEVRAFVTDELVLVAPAGHPWAQRRSVAVTELAGQPLVVREPGSGTRQLVEERLRALGIEPTISLELGAIEAIKNAVAAGLGLAFISRLAIQTEERLGSLVVVPVEGLDLGRPFYQLRHRQRHASPAAQAFLELVESEGLCLLPEQHRP
ncbi:MAG: selenium metabolism-associated LysR family transcriptional regulator [Anaerolineae bacterium]